MQTNLKDAYELYEEGLQYYNQNDFAKAVELFTSAADNGSAEALCKLGVCFLNGEGVEKNLKAAFDCFFEAANKGVVEAQNRLGVRYGRGEGVEKDEMEAVRWYKIAAEQGYDKAQFNLGFCYKNGSGVEKDEKAAFEWYKKAAEQGDAKAQWRLGACYKNGTDVEKDEKAAFEWYKKAAEQGYDKAQNSLGECYRFGYGVEIDEKKAFALYIEAAKNGNRVAAYNIGECYQNAQGTEKDNRTAAAWYEKSAELGYAHSQCVIGDFHLDGLGSYVKDEAAAAEWYRKAADQDFAEAQYKLGVLYEDGRGVPENQAEAVKLFILAAEHGHTEAKYKAGCCYQYGDGVDKNYEKAIIEFTLAAEKGHKDARRHLDDLRDKIHISKELEQEIEKRKQAEILWEQAEKELAELQSMEQDTDELSDRELLVQLLAVAKENLAVSKATSTEVTEVRSDTTEIKADVKRIVEVMNDVGSEIKDLRTLYKDDMDKFFREAEAKVNRELETSIKEPLKNARETLQLHFGDIWDKLLEDTRKSLVSSWTMWEQCKNYKDGSFDFSGIIICATGALENELKRIMFYGLTSYMLSNPDGAPIKDKIQSFAKTDFFTLATISYICSGGIKIDKTKFEGAEKDIFDQLREDYLKSIMFDDIMTKYKYKVGINDRNNKGLRPVTRYTDFFTKWIFDLDGMPVSKANGFHDDGSLVAKIEYIKENFRNKSAHTDTISGYAAEECCDMIINCPEQLEVIRSVIKQIYQLIDITKISYNDL